MVASAARESYISQVEVVFTRLAARPSTTVTTPTSEMPSSIRQEAMRLALRSETWEEEETRTIPRRAAFDTEIIEMEIEITEPMRQPPDLETTAPLGPTTMASPSFGVAMAETVRAKGETNLLSPVAPRLSPPPPRPMHYLAQPYPTPVPYAALHFDPRTSERPYAHPSEPPPRPSVRPPAPPRSALRTFLVVSALATTFMSAAAAAFLYFV